MKEGREGKNDKLTVDDDLSIEPALVLKTHRILIKEAMGICGEVSSGLRSVNRRKKEGGGPMRLVKRRLPAPGVREEKPTGSEELRAGKRREEKSAHSEPAHCLEHEPRNPAVQTLQDARDDDGGDVGEKTRKKADKTMKTMSSTQSMAKGPRSMSSEKRSPLIIVRSELSPLSTFPSRLARVSALKSSCFDPLRTVGLGRKGGG